METTKITKKRPGYKRLSVDIPTELWKAIYEHADFKNITISKWVRRTFLTKLREEAK